VELCEWLRAHQFDGFLILCRVWRSKQQQQPCSSSLAAAACDKVNALALLRSYTV
jgi:CHASE1-domain containing sensor protein